MDTFTIKALEVRFNMARYDKDRSITLRNLAMEAEVEKNGPPDLNRATIRIWGMERNLMDGLTFLGMRPLESERRTIELYAGEKNVTPSLVFQGEIASAAADFSSSPDVVFTVSGVSGSFLRQQVIPPRSINGAMWVEDMIKQLAGIAGYHFSNRGVHVPLLNSYLEGSALAQAFQAAKEAGVDLLLDDGCMVLLPKGGKRDDHTIKISSETGLIGYPSFHNDGLSLSCLYNPGLQLGGIVEVQSIVPRASGLWRITQLTHSLAAVKVGPWQSNMEVALI